MKRFVPIAWYALGLVSLAGLWLGWRWFSEPLWPLVCFLTGRLSRHELKLDATVFDRAFESRWVEKFAVGSIAAVVLGISGYIAWLKYVEFPANNARDVQEFKEAWHAQHNSSEEQK